MKSVNKKRTVFPMKLKLQGNRSNKHIKKENLTKDLVNLIGTNHQINMTSGHSLSNYNSFESCLNEFQHVFNTVAGVSSTVILFIVCCNGDVNL